MTIFTQRTVQEISPLQELDELVAENESVVADWKRSVAALETELNTANASLARAKGHRETKAMAARLGDATAIAAIKAARSEQHAAEQDIVDLQIALPEAQAQLAIAKKNAASARHAVAKVIAGQKMVARVKVAGQIDSVVADLTQLLSEFEKLGNQIANMEVAVPHNMLGMSNHENAIGLRRVRAALPKLFDRIFPNSLRDEMQKTPLEKSEAAHWNLPLESETRAA
jgi:hypothetical protein